MVMYMEREMFESVPDFCEPKDTFTIVWGVKKVGWGELEFYVGQDKKVHCQNECMSKEFIKEQLCRMIDECVLDDPPSMMYRE